MDQMISKKVMFPTLGVIGINAGLEWLITGSLAGTPQFGFQAADGVAFASQAVVSGIAWKMYGTVPGIIGILEAVIFAGLKLAMTPGPSPIRPLTTAPKPAGGGLLPSSLVNAAESIPGAKGFLQKFGVAGLAMVQQN